MEELFEYLLKSAGVLAVFVGVYHFLLRRLTFFHANRWFLLLGMVASIVFPLIEITQTVYVEQPTFVYLPQQVTTSPAAQPLNDTNQFLLILYLAVTLFFLGKMTVELLSLRRLIRSGQMNPEDGFVIVSLSRKVTPFSFFNYICYYKEDRKNADMDLIIQHEKVHVRDWHSIDLLLSHLFRAFFWVNPLAWILKRQVGENLEFIADATAKVANDTGLSYERTLLSTAASHMQPALANNFFTPFIKKRIQMLQKETSKKWNAYKYALILPVLAIFLYSFNTVTKTKYIKTESNPAVEVDSSEKINNYSPAIASSKKAVMQEEILNASSSLTDIKIVIEPTTQRESIEQFATNLKEDHNVDLDIKTLKYRGDKIVKLKLKLDDNRGSEVTYATEDNKGIDTVCINGSIDTDESEWSMGNCEASQSANVFVFDETEMINLPNMPDDMSIIYLDSLGNNRFMMKDLDSIMAQSYRFVLNDSLVNNMADFHMINMDSIQEIMRLSMENINMEELDMKEMQQQLKKAQTVIKRLNMDSLTTAIKDDYKYVEITDSMRREMKKMRNMMIMDREKMMESRNQIRQFKDEDYRMNRVEMDSLRNQLKEMREQLNMQRVQLRKFNADSLRSNDMYIYTDNNTTNFSVPDGKKPLYIVDGKEATESELRAIKANDIESISVLKDKAAIDKYGAKAVDGVIVIETKK
jgi:TonB-dependent SusC/RagA subfamily outer membrane receptor